MSEYINIVEPGYAYDLNNVDGGEQVLLFIKKAPKTPEDSTLETVQNGTTNEAVIAVAIDRLKFLDGLMPSDFNKDAIMHLEAALSALESRTADRKQREVEGTHQA